MFLFSFSAKFRKWTDRLWRQLTKKYALFFVASIRIVTKWRDKTSVETTSWSVERTKCIKYGRNKEARAEKCKHAKHEVWKKSIKWRNTNTIFERLKKAKKTSKCPNHTNQSGTLRTNHQNVLSFSFFTPLILFSIVWKSRKSYALSRMIASTL